MSITCSNARRGSSRSTVTNDTSESRSASATTAPFSTRTSSTPASVPTAPARSATQDRPSPADLLLQLHDPVYQGLGRRRTTGHIDIHRHDAIAAAHHRVGVMV